MCNNNAMEKLTIKAYAKRHKLSIFNVVKLVRANDLRYETQIEDGKEVIYILEDKVQDNNTEEKSTKYHQTPLSLEKEIEILKKELQALREEVNVLKSKLS